MLRDHGFRPDKPARRGVTTVRRHAYAYVRVEYGLDKFGTSMGRTQVARLHLYAIGDYA